MSDVKQQGATSLQGKRNASRYFSYRNEGDEFYVSENLDTSLSLEHFISEAAKRARALQGLMQRGTITVAIEQQWSEPHPVVPSQRLTKYETLIVYPDGRTAEIQPGSFTL